MAQWLFWMITWTWEAISKITALFSHKLSNNPDDMLLRFIIVNEILFHQNTSEIKQQQSKQYKSKVSLSANNVITTVFWDAFSVIPIDCLQKAEKLFEPGSNTFSQEERALPPRQGQGAHERSGYSKIVSNIHRISPPVTLSCFQSWKMAWRKEISLQEEIILLEKEKEMHPRLNIVIINFLNLLQNYFLNVVETCQR